MKNVYNLHTFHQHAPCHSLDKRSMRAEHQLRTWTNKSLSLSLGQEQKPTEDILHAKLPFKILAKT
jgi:hypothetical protein